MSANALLPPADVLPGNVYVGKVSRVYDDDTVGVTLDAYGDKHEWPPARWVAAGQAAVRGDTALVLIDDAGGTWAFPSTAYIPYTPPAPDPPPPVYYDTLQEGVLVAADCALTVNSTSQVTIAAAGGLYVRNAAGLLIRNAPAATVLSAIPAASASNFRLDQVVADAAGVVTRLPGTQGTGVTLANRTGVAAIPSGSRLLHDILVTSGGVLIANCRDRRPRAGGMFVRKSLGVGTTTLSNTVGGWTSFGLDSRIECTGRPVRAKAWGHYNNNTAGCGICNRLRVDGVEAEGVGTARLTHIIGNVGAREAFVDEWTFTPTAGSHLFGWDFTVSQGGTATLYTQTGEHALYVSYEEILRDNSDNGST